jgi:hypothetical protein
MADAISVEANQLEDFFVCTLSVENTGRMSDTHEYNV